MPVSTGPCTAKLILCARTNAAVAHYVLDGLPSKVMAAEYQTVSPDKQLLVEELDRTQHKLEAQPPVRHSVNRTQSNRTEPPANP